MRIRERLGHRKKARLDSIQIQCYTGKKTIPSCRQCAKSTVRLSKFNPPLPHCWIFIRENKAVLQLITVMILQLQSTVRNSILTPPRCGLSTARRQYAKSTIRLLIFLVNWEDDVLKPIDIPILQLPMLTLNSSLQKWELNATKVKLRNFYESRRIKMMKNF